MSEVDVQVGCPECNAINSVRVPAAEIEEGGILHLVPVSFDVGHIECASCGADWCKCSEHGIYRCPPPCPDC